VRYDNFRPHDAHRFFHHFRHIAVGLCAGGVAVGATVAACSAATSSTAATAAATSSATATATPGAAATTSSAAATSSPTATKSAAAATASAASSASGTTTPSHVYAPYVGVYDTSSGHLASLVKNAGVKYVSLAFLQTPKSGSCTADWNGDSSTPISTSDFGSDFAAIQAEGGNVIPSFGGETADGDGTELADSCDNVDDIAKVYESLATTYSVTRIDLDIEGDSVNNSAGITRRNEAIAEAEKWAAANDRVLQFDYTVPVDTTGLGSSSLNIIKNAIQEGADVSVVNLMTFDYYYGGKQDMLANTEDAANAVHGQLKTLYLGKRESQLWDMIGVTEMPGIDDYGSDETFTTADATELVSWAKSKDIGEISIWSLERDNGNCPGEKGADECSGVSQSQYQFSHTFENFG
jgi:hypothetical protein